MKISFQNVYTPKNVVAFSRSILSNASRLDRGAGSNFETAEFSNLQPLSADIYDNRTHKSTGRLIYSSILKSLNEKLENPYFYTPELKKTRDILKENRDELIEIFDSSFSIMQDEYPFEPSKFDYSNWTPSMGFAEAKDYAKNSKYGKEIFYRSSHTPERAKVHGYSLSRTNASYPGVYVSNSRKTALNYGEKPLSIVVRVNNTTILKGPCGFENKLFRVLDVNCEDKELFNTLKNIKGVVEHGFAKHLNIDAFVQEI